jgi:hypothetical protein
LPLLLIRLRDAPGADKRCVVKGANLVLDENNEVRDASGACIYEGIIGEDDLRLHRISSMVSARRKSARKGREGRDRSGPRG